MLEWNLRCIWIFGVFWFGTSAWAQTSRPTHVPTSQPTAIPSHLATRPAVRAAFHPAMRLWQAYGFSKPMQSAPVEPPSSPKVRALQVPSNLSVSHPSRPSKVRVSPAITPPTSLATKGPTAPIQGAQPRASKRRRLRKLRTHLGHSRRKMRMRRRHRRHRRIDVALARVGAISYQKHCASCHHAQRRGTIASPLLPPFLRRTSDARLFATIAQGLPATQMPPFRHLGPQTIRAIVEYLRTPGTVHWHPNDILHSRTLFPTKPRTLKVHQQRNLTAMVERGKSRVWLMEGTRILDQFSFGNVHGGIKFTSDGTRFFVPSRDGWVGGYSLKEGRYFGKVRACVYTRNIAVTRDSRYILAACWIPKAIVVLESKTLRPFKLLPMRGEVSAIYTLSTRAQAVFTMRKQPKLGILDTQQWTISWHTLDEPLHDFFLDPLEAFVVGSARRGRLLKVLELSTQRIVFQQTLQGMPHLFAATFWYHNGQFFFATPHMRWPYLTVWRMYQWKLVRKVPTGGFGFFVRTHPETPYLWADNGSDQLLLIHKHNFAIQHRVPSKGQKLLHTEFSGDGQLAYVSIYEKRGSLIIYDAITLEERKRFQASIPVGKYNFQNKQHKFESIHWGREVFLAKCWGCHHPTHTAFGPSFREIASRRHSSWIRAQLLNPAVISKHLGYKRNAMPKIQLNASEIEVLVRYIQHIGSKGK